MSWDSSKGRARNTGHLFDPFQKITSEWKARRLAKFGAIAAGTIAATNSIAAALWLTGQKSVDTLLGSDPVRLGLVSAAIALAALLACVVVHRRQPLWLSWTVLAWSVLESLPWITITIYGHGAPVPLPVLMLLTSVLGVRGALALHRGRYAP